MSEQEPPAPRTRRAVIAGGLGAIGAAAVGYGAGRLTDSPAPAPAVETARQRLARTVTPYGRTQAGIDRPAVPQPFGLVAVGDLADRSSLSFLPGLGELIATMTTSPPAEVLPDGPAELTITVGLGPRVVAARDPGGLGAEPLPEFAKDSGIDQQCVGGDLLLAAYANDPSVLGPVMSRLTGSVPGYRARWEQRCFRGPGDGTVVRNPLGFLDGIQVPHTSEELNENVFLDAPAGATICVVRRLRLDADRFHRESLARREQIIGRRLDGSPLSGGQPLSVVNVDLKTPEGQYLIPARAHVRAAHPSFTGSHLMLRRGYSFDNGGVDSGLMFICFQRELRTFVMTQRRLDTVDDLSDYVTPTASGTFLIMPGFGRLGRLGDT